ncbi:4060_t:CDS:2, partial [Gigaspora margarita]
NSAISIDSNIVKLLVQNQSHLNITPECYSLLIEPPASGMHFNSWTEIDNYIDAYCSSKNFSKIIYSAEYDSELRRRYHYQCEFQGQYRSKKKMIAEEQHNIYSKQPMLADIEFWTTKGNLSMRTQRQLLEAKYANVFFLPQDLSNAIQKVKKEQQVDDEAAILINHLLERKAEDTRWIVNWRVDPTNNSLVSLFWITPDQYELYVQYNDVVQYDNTYSTNRFKMALGLLLIVDNNNWSPTNIFPSVIITDNDLAIDTAIESIIDYLTPAALSMQRQEIAQAIWYTPQQVDKNHVFEIENEVESFNTGFAEDTVDVPLILLKELIPTNHYNDIVEIWEIVHHRCTKKNYVVLFNDHFHLCTCLESSEETVYTETYIELSYKVADISYKRIHKSLNQRKEY